MSDYLKEHSQSQVYIKDLSGDTYRGGTQSAGAPRHSGQDGATDTISSGKGHSFLHDKKIPQMEGDEPITSKPKRNVENKGLEVHEAGTAEKLAGFVDFIRRNVGNSDASNLEALYRQRKALQATEKPKYFHEMATGQSLPPIAAFGHSEFIPLLSMILSLKNPKLGAMMNIAQMIAKQTYKAANPTKLYKDIAFAKALGGRESAEPMSGVPNFEMAKNITVQNIPRWKRFLGIG